MKSAPLPLVLTTTICTLAFSAYASAQDKKKAEPRAKSNKAAASRPAPDEKVLYKTVGDVKLHLHVFHPADQPSKKPRTAIVFFFGGGWMGGSPSQFYPHCRYLAERGMFACAAEYRVNKVHKTSPFECVKDGKSAVRWLRENAQRLNIDPNRIAAGGGSAGGHVAAATVMSKVKDEDQDNTKISCFPNALVLFNPVYDNGPDGYGYSRVKDRYQDISPMHNMREQLPPTLVFLGTKDKLIPVATAKTFQSKMKQTGNRSELMLFPEAAHGFFNFGRGDAYRQTVHAMDEFLQSTGYLTGAAKIDGSGAPPLIK